MASGKVIDLGGWLRRKALSSTAEKTGGGRTHRGCLTAMLDAAEKAAADERLMVASFPQAGYLRDWHAHTGDLARWRALSDCMAEALREGRDQVYFEAWMGVGDEVRQIEMMAVSARRFEQREVDEVD